MSTIINAIFDSGYFQKIILKDTKEELLYQREKDKETSEVPSWFMNLYDFNVPVATTTVSSGWIPVGSIHVLPIEDNAHKKLYRNFIEILQSFALISLISFSLLYFLLRVILSSLKKVTEQAEAVSNNNFILNENIPSTIEFKEVTLAINNMVEKVKIIFEKEASSVQDYHKLLYIDPLTGLYNRSFLELKLNDFLASHDADAQGYLLSIYFDGITEANKKLGNAGVDTFIQKLCNTILSSANTVDNSLTARLDGTKVCIVFPQALSEDIIKLGEDLLTMCLVDLDESKLQDYDASIKILLSHYDNQDNTADIFEKLQRALEYAQKNTITDLTLNTQDHNALHKELIENRIKEHLIALAIQDVVNNQGDILHSEAYVRLFDEDKNIHEAGSFIPLVHKMNLDTKLDQNVINYALKEPSLSEKNIAINLSLRFLQDADAKQWLKERLAGVNGNRTLNFEISNHNLVSALNEALEFSSLLLEHGHNFGIDRFNIEEDTNLNYLQMIKPAYLKIDATYLLDMLKGEQGQRNHALQILIESLDIKIIATNIESQEVKNALEEIGINYFQGSFLSQAKLCC